MLDVEDTGEKYCTDLQTHFIKFQAELQERHQTLRQGGYKANDLIGIEEEFSNLDQVKAKDRTTMTNLNVTNINLTNQVVEYTNHPETKEYEMTALTKTTSQIQGKIKPLKSKLAGHNTKRPISTQKKIKPV